MGTCYTYLGFQLSTVILFSSCPCQWFDVKITNETCESMYMWMSCAGVYKCAESCALMCRRWEMLYSLSAFQVLSSVSSTLEDLVKQHQQHKLLTKAADSSPF